MDIFDFSLYLGYGLAIFAFIIAVLLAIINSLGDKQSIVKSGLSIAAMAVVFFAGYLMADNEVTTMYAKFNIGPDMSKLIGGSLIMSYLLSGIIFFALIYTEIAKAFK